MFFIKPKFNKGDHVISTRTDTEYVIKDVRTERAQYKIKDVNQRRGFLVSMKHVHEYYERVH